MRTDICPYREVSMFYGTMLIAASIYCLIAAIRSPRISPELQERAGVCALSWPTDEGDAFTADSLLRTEAKPTPVDRQVTN